MALRDWISNPGRVATATVATLATLTPEKQRTVATVATVSVARAEKEGKSSTIETVPTLPRWCRADCPGLEPIPLAKEGDVAGCVNPVTGTWRRLDWMTACPVGMVKAARLGLPSWCRVDCENLRQASGGAAWCCQETDERHWRISRVDRMNGCPMAKVTRIKKHQI